KNEMMFRAFDLSFAQNWNPSTLPWDELDGKNFDPKERIAQAYWMSKLALFEKSGIGAFGFGIVRAAELNLEDPTKKMLASITYDECRDETRHLVATMALLRAMSQEFTEEQKLTVTRQMKQGFIFLSPLLYEHKSEFWRLPSDFDKVDHELEQIARDSGLGCLTMEEKVKYWRQAIEKKRGEIEEMGIKVPAIPEIEVEGVDVQIRKNEAIATSF